MAQAYGNEYPLQLPCLRIREYQGPDQSNGHAAQAADHRATPCGPPPARRNTAPDHPKERIERCDEAEVAAAGFKLPRYRAVKEHPSQRSGKTASSSADNCHNTRRGREPRPGTPQARSVPGPAPCWLRPWRFMRPPMPKITGIIQENSAARQGVTCQRTLAIAGRPAPSS